MKKNSGAQWGIAVNCVNTQFIATEKKKIGRGGGRTRVSAELGNFFRPNQ